MTVAIDVVAGAVVDQAAVDQADAEDLDDDEDDQVGDAEDEDELVDDVDRELLGRVERIEPRAVPAADTFARDVARGHRQPRSPVGSGGGSWWVGKSRQDLSNEAAARSVASSKSAVGRTVRGRINTP